MAHTTTIDTRAKNEIYFSINRDLGNGLENSFHDSNNQKAYIKQTDREKLLAIFIGPERDINRQFSYYSSYSILSKMAKKMHSALISTQTEKLDSFFKDIKEIYNEVPEFQTFFSKLKDSFNSSTNGFEHILDIDFSAYDPNNYFKTLKIISKEGDQVHSFDEFGTGEQQILLMSFIKAYAQTFTGENFIFIIEEPEAHLHPLAQKWLFKNLSLMASEGIQVIISTHSPEFLDLTFLEGFVRVYKDGSVTKTIQNSAQSLVDKCISMHVSADDCNVANIIPYYRINTFYDQLKGFFAKKIILVEGSTELFSLPFYFDRLGLDLSKNGVEIVNCRGKNQIPRNYRLFKSFDYECFCIFDADTRKSGNEDFASLFSIDENTFDFTENKFVVLNNEAGYFGKDFESYMRANFDTYKEIEDSISGSKVFKAKVIAETETFIPSFVSLIASELNLNDQ